jgi:mono/diheme cytochrome c family protein
MVNLSLFLFAGVLVALAPSAVLAPGLSGQETAPAPSAGASTAPATSPVPAAVASPRNPGKVTAESQAKAKTLYKIDCAVCHGDNGDGKSDLATSMSLTLVDWTDAKSLSAKPDSELFNIIRNGKDKMPPEDSSRAKDEDIWNLVVYIRGFSKTPPTAPSTAAK